MKTLMRTSFLFIMLSCALQDNISADTRAGDSANSICCYDVPDIRRISSKRLESYYWTSNSCPLRHIVFVTTANKHICVNPTSKWVDRAKNHIDKKRT